MAYIGKMKDRNGNVVYPQTVVDAITDYTPMDISQPSTLGIAYLNGSYDEWENATKYRTIELPNARFVALSVHLKTSATIDNNNNHRLALLSIPSNIRPMYDLVSIQSPAQNVDTEGVIDLSKDGVVTCRIPNTASTTPNSFGFHAEFLYLSLKN